MEAADADAQPKKKHGSHHITRELIRKRSEHNEGVISTLEELTLHQEELVAIDDTLGMCCRKLKILYLQNNIISKMENLHHMKDLEYLNLALNNVAKIEGLGRCEFLHKLDLTVNFVDLDVLEESIEHLRDRYRLKEMFMMGNPATEWAGFKNYVVATLPQLEMLDGEEITRSTRIVAEQQLPHLRLELRSLAEAKRLEKASRGPARLPETDDEATPYTPEVRTKMYEDIAEQKHEAEERKAHMKPRDRDAEKEQAAAVARAREREEAGHVMQTNEGKWDFAFDEESKPGFILLDVGVPRHLDSSLIDLDVHPTYVSVVIKSKTLRLRLPNEVRASEVKAQRSKTTGHLLISMPKLDAKATALFVKQTLNSKGRSANLASPYSRPETTTTGEPKPATPADEAAVRRAADRAARPTKSLGAQLLSDATDSSSFLKVSSTTRRKHHHHQHPTQANDDDDDDDDEPPPLV